MICVLECGFLHTLFGNSQEGLTILRKNLRGQTACGYMDFDENIPTWGVWFRVIPENWGMVALLK